MTYVTAILDGIAVFTLVWRVLVLVVMATAGDPNAVVNRMYRDMDLNTGAARLANLFSAVVYAYLLARFVGWWA